jgi:potassium efflux system protein
MTKLKSLSRTLLAWSLLAFMVPAGPAPAQTAAPEAQVSPQGQDGKGNAGAPATAAQPPAAQPAAQPAAPPPAPPPVQLPEELQRPISDLQASLESLESRANRENLRDEDLISLRADADKASGEAQRIAGSIRPRLNDVQSQIDKLGAPPEAGQPPEAQEVATERSRLAGLKASLDGGIKTTDLVAVRANNITQRVQELRQQLFTKQLLRRAQSPLMPTIWRQVASELPAMTTKVSRIAGNWWAAASQQPLMLAALIGAVAGLFVLLKACVVFLIRKLLPADGPQPSFFQRAGAAGWVAPALALPGAAAALLLVFGLEALNLLTYQIDQLSDTALPAFLIFIAVSALARAVMAPKSARWRLVDLADKPAARIAKTVSWIAGVYSLDLVLKELIRILYLPLPVSVAVASIGSIAIALLLIRLVRTRFTPAPRLIHAEGSVPPTPPVPEAVVAPPPSTGEPSQEVPPAAPATDRLDWLRPMLLKVPLLVVALAIVLASLSGYIALGRFMAGQMVVTGSVIVLVLLLHLAIRAVIGEPGQEADQFKTIFDERLGLDEHHRHVLGRGASVLLNLALALVALPLVLLTWGFTQADAIEWVRNLVFGFRIGSFEISLAQILIAIGLFLALLIATRLVQRWLSARLSRPPRAVEQGVADSIHTFVGYLGIGLAALAAMSYAGLDVTNFAIVAGALSVGVGLGLQSIVNNFVSGLIILVERPIKVGDLVNVRGQEGYVRRISVRSTEIETGDRASLIVPNSELITNSVTNWTHRNPLARVTVKVGVSYKADPEQVRAILQSVAKECPLVMQIPAPGVGFDNFGANALEFSLTGVVSEVSKAGAAQTDLRMRILKAFRDNGIEIAHAQHDVHLRDLDGVKTMVTALLQERARRAAEEEQETGASQAGGAVPFPRR